MPSIFYKTKKGVSLRMYDEQRRSSKKRNHPQPIYTLSELREWLFSQNKFHVLYENWVNSNYNTYLKPSIDRSDNCKPYTFDNIQLGTWKDNQLHEGHDIKNGILIHNNPIKSVIQLDRNHDIINTFISISEAGRITGIHKSGIARACKKEYSTSGGYYWTYGKEVSNLIELKS
jgi:hypothetical protein